MKKRFLAIVLSSMMLFQTGAMAHAAAEIPNCEATGHHYTSEITNQFNCTHDGIITYTCDDCGDQYAEVVRATGHKEETIKGYAATCTKDGLTDGKKCTTCGEILVPQKTIKATGHKYFDVVKDATCKDAGVKTIICANCNDSRTEVIPEKGHTAKTVKGYAATCTKKGLTDGTVCADCGEVIQAQKEIEATGHDYFEVVKEATCSANGVITYICRHCQDSYTKTIPSTDDHRYVNINRSMGSCEEDNNEMHVCIDCGNRVEEVVKAKGHEWVVIEGVAPTCHSCGYTEGRRCAMCGEIDIERTEIAPVDHNYGEAIVVKDPTCTEAGLNKYVCVDCGKVKLELVDADENAHTDADNDGVCDDCQEAVQANNGIQIHADCHCNCHSNSFAYRLARFFWKLFGMKNKRVCACGDMHW